tara:strand:+ start:688 stop:921 length:234 start_codon:yes stop_codon:yes gene_type:complete
MDNLTTTARNHMAYFVEYTPNENEGKQWEELTEAQFADLCQQHQDKLATGAWQDDVYFAQLTGPTVVLVDKHGLFYS